MPKNINERAIEIAKMPAKKQEIELSKEFKSIGQGLKITSELVEVVKKADSNISEDYKNFSSSCDKAINTIAIVQKDGVVTEEEKQDVRNKIMEIQNMNYDSFLKAHDSHQHVIEKKHDNIKKAMYITGALSALAIICNTILKAKK